VLPIDHNSRSELIRLGHPSGGGLEKANQVGVPVLKTLNGKLETFRWEFFFPFDRPGLIGVRWHHPNLHSFSVNDWLSKRQQENI
jgi:hypothetical protein